jgi:hypothetical protein
LPSPIVSMPTRIRTSSTPSRTRTTNETARSGPWRAARTRR